MDRQIKLTPKQWAIIEYALDLMTDVTMNDRPTRLERRAMQLLDKIRKHKVLRAHSASSALRGWIYYERNIDV